MMIRVNEEGRGLQPAVTVDLAAPPPRVQPKTDGQAVSLTWDRAIDDEKRLRRCPVCGCGELFTRKYFPQLTGFAAVILAVYLFLLLLGNALQWAALGVLVIVGVADAFFYVAGPVKLVCYRCGSEYSGIRPSDHHRRWDAATAEQHRD